MICAVMLWALGCIDGYILMGYSGAPHGLSRFWRSFWWPLYTAQLILEVVWLWVSARVR